MQLIHRFPVPASPSDTWRAIAAFDDVAAWSRDLQESRLLDQDPIGIGTERACVPTQRIMGREHIVERIIAYDEGHSLTYEVPGGIGPFARIRNTWTVEDDGADGSLVRLHARMTPRNLLARIVTAPFARRRLRKVLRDVETDFGAYVSDRVAAVT